MKKGVAFIPLIIIVLLLATGGVVGLRLLSGSKGSPATINPTYEVTKGPSIQPTEQQKEQVSSVPLPIGEDIVRNFFQLIDKKKISEAVMSMSKENTENDSTKQAWSVQFNAFESIKVKSIEAYNKESWTDEQQEFKVNLAVQMKPDAVNAVMPNYGFDNGDNNIRWIVLIKENNLWKINGIATGP